MPETSDGSVLLISTAVKCLMVISWGQKLQVFLWPARGWCCSAGGAMLGQSKGEIYLVQGSAEHLYDALIHLFHKVNKTPQEQQQMEKKELQLADLAPASSPY